MAPSTKTSPTAPLIKGYLPVRLKLPEETFFYVKVHTAKSKSQTDDDTAEDEANRTLFVANCPIVPPIHPKLLLQALFGRLGEIKRVTVISNPRGGGEEGMLVDDNVDVAGRLLCWTDQFQSPSYFRPAQDGRFAHVVFTSENEMKACLMELHNIMSQDAVAVGDDDDNDNENDSDQEEREMEYPGLSLDAIEIQTLADESDRQYLHDKGIHDSDGSDDEDEKQASRRKAKKKKEQASAVLRVATRYRQSCFPLQSRQALLEECNRVMEAYEDAETSQRLARERAANTNEPDEDGFVTVSYNSNTPTASSTTGEGRHDLEEGGFAPKDGLRRRRKTAKRQRTKKAINGKSELTDFYRFQTKQHRKKTLHELRERFDEDLARVKRMKEERQYRPFS